MKKRNPFDLKDVSGYGLSDDEINKSTYVDCDTSGTETHQFSQGRNSYNHEPKPPPKSTAQEGFEAIGHFVLGVVVLGVILVVILRGCYHFGG